MSLDCVEISLSRVFASGQAYVALSRARSLHGLRVLDFDPMVVRCDPQVLNFYATLQRGRGLSLVRGSHPVVGLVAVGRLGARTEGRPRDPEVGVAEPSLAPLGAGTRGRRCWPQAAAQGTGHTRDWASLALIQGSPDDNEAASDQENIDPGL